MRDLRIKKHPILGEAKFGKKITIFVDGKNVSAYEGEMIASALYARGIKKLRFTSKFKEPRGIFCAIGQCTDCVMTVNGLPNVRTCVTPVKQGMKIESQKGLGKWKKKK